MPGAGQDRGLAAPGVAHLDGTRGTGGSVVVRADQQAGEWQRLARDRGEVAQGFRAAAALDIRGGHQQGAAHPLQQLRRRLSRPVRNRDAAQAVRHQNDRFGMGGNAALQLGDPVFTTRKEPVLLLHSGAARQGALPMALPVLIGRAVPARHDQISDAAHIGASCDSWRPV